jgi:hypothetical protein
VVPVQAETRMSATVPAARSCTEKLTRAEYGAQGNYPPEHFFSFRFLHY